MDASVIASMAKWPNVPDCYGWLHLDAQGRWRLGEHINGQAPNRVEHDGLKQFINRNYGATDNGGWALQNGPQRVWVQLALAPLIVSLHAGVVTAHTGQVVQLQRGWLADDGVVYFATSAGPAALASASMEAFSADVQHNAQGCLAWQASDLVRPLDLNPCSAHEIAGLLGFTKCPQWQKTAGEIAA